MLEEKIQIKRKELDDSIQNHRKYEDVYKLSVELDNLIAEFYEETKQNKKKANKKRKRWKVNKILFITRT